MLFNCCIGFHCGAGWSLIRVRTPYRWTFRRLLPFRPVPSCFPSASTPLPLSLHFSSSISHFFFPFHPPLLSCLRRQHPNHSFSSPAQPIPFQPLAPCGGVGGWLVFNTRSPAPPCQTCAISLVRLSPQVRQAGATVAARDLIECN